MKSKQRISSYKMTKDKINFNKKCGPEQDVHHTKEQFHKIKHYNAINSSGTHFND